MWLTPWFQTWVPLLGPVAVAGLFHQQYNTSIICWGAVLEDLPAQRVWEGPLLSWHINCLEMRAVFLALKDFLPQFRCYHVLVCTNITMVVSYINHQCRLDSHPLCRFVQQILLFANNRYSIAESDLHSIVY